MGLVFTQQNVSIYLRRERIKLDINWIFCLLYYYKRKALHLIGERLISNRYASKNSISHVLFPSTQTAYASYDRVVIIYLRKHSFVPPSVQFLQESAPTIIWVSHSWGLPRSTLFVSKQASSLWHFQEVSTISKDLGFPSAVSF